MATPRRSSVVDAVFADVDRANTGPLFGKPSREKAAAAEPAPAPANPYAKPLPERWELERMHYKINQLVERQNVIAKLMLNPMEKTAIRGAKYAKATGQGYYMKELDDIKEAFSNASEILHLEPQPLEPLT